MKRRLLGLVALATVMAMTSSAQGFGGRRKADCGTATTTGGCGTTTSDCGSPCGTTVTYVDQKVMVNEWVTVKEEYKWLESVPVTKKEKVKVKEQAWKDEAFKYTVNETVSVKEKMKVKEAAWKDEAFKYTVNEVAVKEKVKVAECKPLVKEMEFTTYKCVPVVTKQTRTVCETICVPVEVTCTVAPAAPCATGGHGLFGRLCGKKSCDTGCATACETPCPQVVTKTVMQKQTITKQIEVDVTTYTRVEEKHKKPVTTYETVWVEKEVTVHKCVPVEKTGTKKVCHWVDVEKEIDVTTYNKVEKTGTRDVKKCVQVEKVVKVAVHTPVMPAPCAEPCGSPCGGCDAAPACEGGMGGGCGSARGGLFKGGLFKGKGCK